VLCFPGQSLEAAELSAFGSRFGELEHNVANSFHAPGRPEVMVLSNMKEDGKPVGLNDAGQGWHTDMSYSEEIALANVLHAKKVPVRDGRPLGDTQFRDMHAAYEGLPAEVRERLEGRSAIHDFNKFWEMMRTRPGSGRAPLTEEQRRRKPPCRSRSSASTPSPDAGCSTAIPVTRCGSRAWSRRRATPCSNSCSSTSRRTSTSTPTSGRRATC
jgi:taurine dioxygenase